MTTPAPSSPSATDSHIPLRTLTAWALLALAGVIVFFSFAAWVFPASPGGTGQRFRVDSFVSLPVLVAPLLAVIVAVKVGPVLRHTKLITLIALIEYASALVIGTLAFLITFASRFDGLNRGIYAIGGVIQQFGGILHTLLQLGLLALAMLWTYRLFVGAGGRLPQVNIKTD